MNAVTFPDDFVWGVATSSYQIEGAVYADGRSPSNWDVFARREGVIADGSSGHGACDHYRRFRDDIRLMHDLGVGAYRFSVAWPRVMPDGRGRVEQRGLDFYKRLVDGLLDDDIEPFVTLYHWDHPQVLEDAGGWRTRPMCDWFTEYALAVHDALGDRVRNWATINEPWCVAFLGHAAGVHAPGRTSPSEAVAAAHHLLLAHGRATTAMRSAGRPGDRFGIVLNPAPVRAAPTDPASADDVRRIDGTRNRWWLDALFDGRYPQDVLDDVGDWASCVEPGDNSEIAVPLDWLGVNYYNDEIVRVVRADDPPLPSAHPTARGAIGVEPAAGATDIGWPITPSGLTNLLVAMRDRYPGLPPIHITENGAAYHDVAEHGRCVDRPRIAYLDAHLRALQRAIAAGVDVRGYFAWSLMDNFEWAFGYSQRFGLVHVDFETQERTPKASYYWYAQVCRLNGVGE